MKKKWYRIANSSLSALLVLLGFEACTGMENGGEEYGTPTVDFHVVGQVTDAEGKPIEGIRVTTRGYFGLPRLTSFCSGIGFSERASEISSSYCFL